MAPAALRRAKPGEVAGGDVGVAALAVDLAGAQPNAQGDAERLVEDDLQPGAQRLAFGRTHLPPSLRFARLVASAEAARESGEAAELEEIAHPEPPASAFLTGFYGGPHWGSLPE